MEKWIYIILGIAIITAFIGGKNSNKNESKELKEYPYKAIKVMTRTEKMFYDQLKESIPSTYILLSKVRLWDIIDTTVKEKQYIYTNKIKSKHIDFLVVDAETNPIIAIELDDKSHNQTKRIERDEFINKALENAKIKLIRYTPTQKYDFSNLKTIIE